MTIDSEEPFSSSPASEKRDVLLVHHAFPGQPGPWVDALAKRSDFRLWGLGAHQEMRTEAVHLEPLLGRVAAYQKPSVTSEVASHARFIDAVSRGRRVAERAMQLKALGLDPEVIIGHIGWGECLHLRSIFPTAVMIAYCEFFHHPQGVDVGFDPEFSHIDREGEWGIRELNAVELLGLEAMDIGVSPTRWQRDLFPKAYRSRIRIIHEGVDTGFFSPDETASFQLPEGEGQLTRKDKVLTFATSSLEPYRGVHIFLRALPEILKAHPDCHVVIAGSSERVRYGKSPKGGLSRLIDALLKENSVPNEKIHWVGLLDQDHYRDLLRVSSAHVYLTVPFVLSWSLMEAMAVGCSIVASATPPVEEVLKDQENAILVDFHAPSALADSVSKVLSNPLEYQHLGRRARQLVLSRYDRQQTCRSYNGLIDELGAIMPSASRRKIL